MVITIGIIPLGNQPCSVILCKNGAGKLFFIGIKPKIAALPAMINTIMVITLIMENQNSLSAKNCAVIIFNKKMTTQKTKHQIQTDTCGNQYCIHKPAAVKLDPNATVQVNQ